MSLFAPSFYPVLLFGLLSQLSLANIREDFKENPAHIPATSQDLTSPELTLERLGPGADQLKFSHHPEVKNDPFYLWNGQCQGPVLIAFKLKTPLDLSDPKWQLHVGTKNVGDSRLHLALQIGNRWVVQSKAIENKDDWNTQSLGIDGTRWCSLDPTTAVIGRPVKAPVFKKVTSIGFAAPIKPKGSKSCIRLDWFALVSGEPPTGFLEPEAPFLRTALLIRGGNEVNRVRRGVLIPLGLHRWACFDPDLLRWAAVWYAPDDAAPITFDSMAAISYPKEKAKAHAVPALVGDLIFQNPELVGAASGTLPPDDPRPKLLNGGAGGVGPLPSNLGRWLGMSLRGHTPILHYRVGETDISEVLPKSDSENLTRILRVSPHSKPLVFGTGKLFQHVLGEGAALNNGLLTLQPSNTTRTIVVATHSAKPTEFPKKSPAIPSFPETLTATNPPATSQGAFTVRNLAIPAGKRFIRPTDLAFLSNGIALVATLDGDIWRVEGTESETSQWTRVASGIFEPISLEVTKDDRVFVLGRDQITELIDHNQDRHYDEYRNASDAFQQTLQTRDYATSLAVQADGSFLVAKGGIHTDISQPGSELSSHRGTIVHLSADGQSAHVLADGLRLPYVGLRKDGAIFASDQQGNYVPSTPIHLIGNKHPFLGHSPTNFQHAERATEPLVWYPYQANRSGAAFATTSQKGFPDLGEIFLQVSWGGRLFAIETPKSGQAFSWQLPLQFDFPSLNATSHPKSGRLYVTGLGISGYKPTTPGLIGIASVEQAAPFPSPVSFNVREDSIEVVFNRPLAADESIVPGSPALRLFKIERTPQYGSGHFLWDGKPGEHRFQPDAFTLSEDRRTFTLTFPHLHQSDVLDLLLNITSGPNIHPLHLFSRPAHLPPADAAAFARIAELEKNEALVKAGDVERGKVHFTNFACAGCHSLDSAKLVGPSLQGLATRSDEAAMTQSILDPNAVITEGFPAAMPSFAGVLSKQELADILAYLTTLQ